MCDKHQDCDDGTDETKCGYDHDDDDIDLSEECAGFTCDMGHNCFDWTAKCDGHLDCLDGSDEEHCHLWEEDMVIAGLDLKAVLSTHDSLAVSWWLSQPGRLSNKSH